jgi:tRNA(Ile)-lysidine synthase
MWNNIEHQVWKAVKFYNLEQKQILLAVSGGLDSMALIEVFFSLGLKKNIHALHFHHGEFCNIDFRNQAQENIEKYCQAKGISLTVGKANSQLKSEADFRTARHDFFNQYKTENSIYVTGHHLDDVLETRLIKMIRGAGVEGLRSFTEYNQKTFRPLLRFSKCEIMKYAEEKKIHWIEDPTNQETDYLRNWLRQRWLPELNKKHPGAVVNFARSLDRLLEEQVNLTYDELTFTTDETLIPRLWFFGLSTKDQLKVLAKCLVHMKKTDFSSGQLEEINKRLDKNQKDHIFQMCGMNWVLNAQQIMVRSINDF